MLAYFFIFGFIVFSGISSLCYPRFSRILLGASVFIMTVVAGIRGSVGQDTWSYTYLYDNVFVGDNVWLVFLKFEPLFALIIVFSKFLGASAQGFILFVSLLQGVVLVNVVKRLRAPFVFLLLYFLGFYLQFSFNILRVGFACLFFALAMHERDVYKSLCYFLLATLFHFSVIPFVFVFFLLGRWPKRWFFVSLFILSSVFLAFFSNLLSEKFRIYVLSSEATGLSFYGFVLFLGLPAIYFAASFIVGRVDKRVFFLFLGLLVLGVARHYFDIAYRLYDVFSFILLVCFFCLYSLSDVFKSPRVFSYFIVLAVLVMIRVVGVLGEADSIRGVETKAKIDYTFIPYSVYWKEPK